LAASIQGPAVTAGSLFAILQSLGATGMGILLWLLKCLILSVIAEKRLLEKFYSKKTRNANAKHVYRMKLFSFRKFLILICASSTMLLMFNTLKNLKNKAVGSFSFPRKAQRPVESILDVQYSIPTILHQSWKTKDLPAVSYCCINF
jgi:hypothetical protein